MDVVAYAAGLIILVVLAGIGVAALLSASAQAGTQRREKLQTRRIARQPWEAQGANGRGIR